MGMSVTCDQVSAAAGCLARNWGDYGYRFTGIESVTHAVAVFSVRCSDGEFAILADKWGNAEPAPDDLDQRAAKIRDMHAHAVTP
jgi:hypothetical protein